MKILEDIGGCVPTLQQVDLIRVGLSPPSDVVSAWEEWTRHNAIEDIQDATLHLLPLIYHNLHCVGYAGPEMVILKGTYRRNWFFQHKLFHSVEKIMEQFRAHHVRPLLLKGTALSHLYYPDPATRSMMDADVMVPLNQVDQAMQILRQADWQEKHPLKKRHPHSSHAQTFRHPQMYEIDLHWHLLSECCAEKDDDVFWQQAKPMMFQGLSVLTLSPTDHLLHICLHGYKWNWIHPVRWVVDASLILKKDKALIDWDRLVEEVRRRKLSFRLRAALSFLRNTCGVDIPDTALSQFVLSKVSGSEKREHRIVTRENRLHKNPRSEFIWPLRMMWTVHRRLTPGETFIYRFLLFPAFVAEELGLTQIRRLPAALLNRTFKRLKFL